MKIGKIRISIRFDIMIIEVVNILKVSTDRDSEKKQDSHFERQVPIPFPHEGKGRANLTIFAFLGIAKLHRQNTIYVFLI